MKPHYYKYQDSKYVVLEDGNVARILKPTKIHKQTYYNLIVDGKYTRINAEDLMKPFDEVNDDALNG
jgi:hypothetical protein